MKTYEQLTAELKAANIPLGELVGDGCVAVTPAAGRIIGLAFGRDEPNLLWTHPMLTDADLVVNRSEKLNGGIGGDRLWFAPELSYNWSGEPNWQTFSNYASPAEMDPGSYSLSVTDSAIKLRSSMRLQPTDGSSAVDFTVERTIELCAPPFPRKSRLLEGVRYVGTNTTNRIAFDQDSTSGQIDLWHLLQVPVGSTLIVPLRTESDPPLSYGLPGDWEANESCLSWMFGGSANAKIGLGTSAVTGRSAVLQRLEADDWCLLVREFPVDADAFFVDHPFGQQRNDQVFQAWDGFGFGEMEFHSPGIDASAGPREIQQSDRLWAFGGDSRNLAIIGKELLGIDIERFFHDASQEQNPS
jgi:hypothetical protein